MYPTFYQSFREGDNFPKGIICIELGELSNLGCMTFNCYFILTEPSKDDIKCTLQADHGNGGIGRLRE